MIIRISGLPPYNGEHDATPPFNAREWNIIKKTTDGVVPATWMDATRSGDPSIIIALAIIALRRAGNIVNEDALWDQWYPSGEAQQDGARIEIEFPEAADAVPPPQQSEQSRSEPTPSSGTSGNGDGASHPESAPNGTGVPASDTPAIYGQVT